MHQFPNSVPDIGNVVEIHLASGGILSGNWDGLQWWCGVDGQPDDVPVTNSFVIGWSNPPQV